MKKKPSFTEAIDMKYKADWVIMSYTWPFFAILIAGVLIVYLNFPEISEKKFLISLGLFIILGLIINIIYYKKQRENKHG